MLPFGFAVIDRHALEMGQFALGEQRADRSGERAAHQRSLAADDLAALHDHADVLDGGDVAGRVAVDRDEVGEQAQLDLAAIAEAEDPGVARGRGDQHLRGGHAGALHRVHFEPVLPMAVDPDIAAHADRHAGLHREGERAAVFLHAFGRGFAAVPMLEIAGIGLGRARWSGTRAVPRSCISLNTSAVPP